MRPWKEVDDFSQKKLTPKALQEIAESNWEYRFRCPGRPPDEVEDVQRLLKHIHWLTAYDLYTSAQIRNMLEAWEYSEIKRPKEGSDDA